MSSERDVREDRRSYLALARKRTADRSGIGAALPSVAGACRPTKRERDLEEEWLDLGRDRKV